MTRLSKTSLENFSPLKAILHRSALTQKGAGKDAPLRSDLFSASQMEQHGRTLAALHKLDEDHAPERLLARLAENEAILLEVRDLVTEAV
ncbi:MAG: hypothetical protein ABSH25_02295, partial [Syntrophorhabdales bacterium]